MDLGRSPRSCWHELDHRHIRVFISSTFSDMQRERDLLAKRVFPKIRRLCAERHVIFTEVDLRWGVTDEQSAEGQVLPICLEQIRQCRPYFIGLLGERYGWIPRAEDIPQRLLDEQPWLRENLQKSVTELEILHGVLNESAISNHAYFYFRDPAYAARLAEGGTRTDYMCASPEEAGRLRWLKERISERSLVLRADQAALASISADSRQLFPLRVDYRDPEQLAEWVERDLTELVNHVYPRDQAPDLQHMDALSHDTYALGQARVYVGRQLYLDRLDAHVASADQPMVITGESGSGKTSLLANWGLRYRREHPDEHVIFYFIGATPHSANWVTMVLFLIQELSHRFRLTDDIPTEPDELRRAFPIWLHRAASRERFVLVLDGLDQLDDRENALELSWLPPEMPEGVHLFASMSQGPTLEEIEHRRWPTMQVQPLDEDERSRLIRDYLAAFSKSLSSSRVSRIASARASASPLYLRTLMEELRLFGEHDRLDERIDWYLQADSVPALFERILSRWEQDYEPKEYPGLVCDAMTAIWASRRGLLEHELLGILGDGDTALPASLWALLHLGSEAAITERSGHICFVHRFAREAVKQRYLATDEDEQAAHLRLADYFQCHPLDHAALWQLRLVDPSLPPVIACDRHQVQELPWQLMQAQCWQRLYNTLANPHFLKVAALLDFSDVRSYWASVEQHSSLHMVDAYGALLEAPGHHFIDYIREIAALLDASGYAAHARDAYGKLSDYYRDVGDMESYCSSLGSKAMILRRTDALQAAQDALFEVARVCRATGDRQELQRTLLHQATVMREQGDSRIAQLLCDEVEQICRETDNDAGMAHVLFEKAHFLAKEGNADAAMEVYAKSEHIARMLGLPDVYMACRGALASLHKKKGDYAGAVAAYQALADMARRLGDPSRMADALVGMSSILLEQAELEQARELLQEAISILRKVNNLPGLADCLTFLGTAAARDGNVEEALGAFRDAADLFAAIRHNTGLAQCLVHEAQILNAIGRISEARSSIDRARIALGRDFYFGTTALAKEAIRMWRLLNRG